MITVMWRRAGDDGEWRLYGHFEDDSEALAICVDLRAEGHDAKLVPESEG